MNVTTIQGDTVELVPGITLNGAMLRDQNLDGVDLRGSSLRDCYFNASSLVGANLSGCDLTGAVFYRADLSGADLSGSTLTDCYWNEFVQSSATKWPDDGSAPPRIDPLATLEVGDYLNVWKGGLCNPGATDPDSFDGIVSPLQSIVDGLASGPVTPAVSARLFARMAMNLHRSASLMDDLCSCLTPYEAWPEELDYEPEKYSFTAAVLMLAALGIRFERVNDDGTVTVTFRPEQDMRRFAEHDAVRLFRLLLELESGREVDADATLRTCVDLPFEFEAGLSFAHEEGEYLDVTAMIGHEDSDVRVVQGDAPQGTPEDELLRTIYGFVHLAAGSEFVKNPDDERDDTDEDPDDDQDEEFDEDEDLDHEEEPVNSMATNLWGSDKELILYRTLGVVSLERTAAGHSRAVLRPPMDIEKLVREAGLEQEDRTLASLGLVATKPDLRAFSWLAS